MPERNKRLIPRLIAYLDRRLWAGPDASARAVGLEVRKSSWHRRTYRDPRFDSLPKERDDIQREVAAPSFRHG